MDGHAWPFSGDRVLVGQVQLEVESLKFVGQRAGYGFRRRSSCRADQTARIDVVDNDR